MDELVRQAMAKWPNVPAVFDWLSLDLRGNWLLKGERIGNPLLNDFIGRNYTHDDVGRWFFQNGPQRVFVRLSHSPWVLRLGEDGQLVTHTNLPVENAHAAWLDETGTLVLETEHGPALLDDRDADAFSARLVDASGRTPDEDGLLQMIEDIAAGRDAPLVLPWGAASVRVRPISSREVPMRLGYVRDPRPDDCAVAAG